jgi:tetratricopeptide (TPR) repeat protein
MSCEDRRMRIVDVRPVRGKNERMQAYRAWLRTGLIGVISAVLVACATAPAPRPDHEPAPALAADDLALVERMQAEYALQGGDREAAAERLAKAAMLSEGPDQSLSALRAALYAGNRSGAQVLFARWRGLAPDAPALNAYAAAIALASGDSAAAQSAADALGQGDVPRRRLAEALRWIKSAERVLPFVELRVANSTDIEDWIHWSAFARDRRAPEVAMRLADLAISRFPDDARGYSLRAALVRERDPAAAVGDLERALAIDPTSATIRLSLAHAYDAAGDSAKAAAVVADITPASDASVSAEIAYAARADDAAALALAYRHLQDLPEPRSPQRLMLLGHVAELVGQSAAAERWYAGVPKGSQYAAAQLRLATLQFSRGDAAATITTVTALRATGLLERDDLVRSYLLEGEVRQKAESAAAALQVFEAGLRMLPDDGELMYARALMYAEAGRDEDMERELRRMIELDPSDGDALNALGYTLVDHNRDLDEAAALLARAEKITPDSAALLDSLGWLAYRRGDLEGALEKLRAAHAKLDDPEVAAHLGEVLWQKGERDEAQRIWAEALKREPGHRTVVETMRRLQP